MSLGPGNFLEVTKLLPILTSGGGGNPAFHVIAPSLPNYGFSGVVRKPNFGLEVKKITEKEKNAYSDADEYTRNMPRYATNL